ncbi:MAG TPA: protein-glutamate O-methyltransferase CheR [Spirochaetes bacterium]|nr:protein-glutamate O-methyltransferase CheR [Spirochaetota bacterium]
MKNILHDRCGIEIPAEKKYLFKTRLSDLLAQENIPTFRELHSRLQAADGRLTELLIEFMTTNETSFFRDGHPFKTLISKIIPKMAEKTKKINFHTSPGLRIWSAGCSSGQEPYSVAMTLMEWLENETTCSIDRISILATDISEKILEKAEKGIYTENELQKGLPHNMKEKYFRKNDTCWLVDDKLRNIIKFQILNLAKPFSCKLDNFDIILCRNVIIYFSAEFKRKIIDQISDLLNPGGVLILGASENLYNISSDFEARHAGRTTIYYRVKK